MPSDCLAAARYWTGLPEWGDMGDILFFNFKTHDHRKSGQVQKQSSAQIVFFPGIRVDRSQLEGADVLPAKAKTRGPRKPKGKKQA